uniref:FYVE-type domain-containing protein n=1 Tax=Phytophthora ramorum TaxID=164328 RepID=H3GU27_PHYRM
MASMGDPVRGSGHSTSRSGRSSARNNEGDAVTFGASCANLKHGYNGAANGYRTGKLPLPDDFFPVPQLSSKENKYLLGLAKHACKEVVYYSRPDDGPMKWLHLSSDEGVDVFQGVDNSSTSQHDAKALTYLRGSCRIHATIDEISDFFKLDTSEKLAGFTQTVGKDLLDQKTLLTLATPTPDNPKHYVAVKWTAVESPSKLARHRDFCYIECHDEFIDTNTKRRGWVRSIHSIRLPFCPPLNRSHGLVRGSFYRSGFIFTESAEKGYVDAVHTLHVDIKGNAPNWLKIMVMKRRIKNIAEVDRYFQLQRLTQERLLGDLELPAKERATRCQLCETRFGFFHRRRVCRKCGKVVCTPCGNEFLLDYGELGPKKVRICLECSESVMYGVSVPMMDAEGLILADSHADVKKIEGSRIRPMYDESMAFLENRQLSIEEHEYYMQNEDESGIADMEEAKRMNKEFEELLKSSSDKFSDQAASSAVALLGASIRASDEAVLAETPLTAHDELSPWREERQRVDEDDMEDDDELGLPPSKSEQLQLQMQYEEQRRQEQFERAKMLQQFATDPASAEYGEQRPRANGISRNESGDSLRLSSEWGDEYYPANGAIEHNLPAVMASLRSNGSGRSSSSGRGVTRADLSGGNRSRSGSQGATSTSSAGRDYRFRNGGIPRPHRNRHNSNEEGRAVEDDLEVRRRTQQYFDARNARFTLLSQGGTAGAQSCRQQYDRDEQLEVHNSVEELFSYEHPQTFERPITTRFRSSGVGAGSDPPARRQLTRSELESPYTSLSDSNLAGAFTTRRRNRSDDLENRDDEALRLAMSAMRLYDEEHGHNLQVTEETRQAALSKMMEVYAREIERSHSNDSGPYSRGTISDTRRLHHNVGIPPPLRRTVSDDRSPSLYGSPLQVYRHDDLIGPPRRQRRTASSKHSRDVPRASTKKPSLPAKRDTSAEAQEYRDLSDLTSSAFQAFQMNSLGPRDAPKLPVDVIESSGDSDRSKDEYQTGENRAQTASVPFKRESTSTMHVELKSDTSGGRSGAAQPTYSSIADSELPNMISRPNSMYGVAGSDTFSDMDLIDLPHLMRNDDQQSISSGARNSFADLQRWKEESTAQALGEEHGGIEYEPEPRISDLLSPLHLEGVQHVEGDDSESDRSSNASSQIDWQSSLANKYPEAGEGGRRVPESESPFVRPFSISREKEVESYSELTKAIFANNGLSESMVTQNEQARGHYRKPSATLSELLSEYNDSERSSLPSYLEFGGSQPELEPEYLLAIENANNQNFVPMEGRGRAHVRRRSSIPSELETISSHELFM